MTTSNSICKIAEFKSSTFLKAHCSCGSDEHTHTLILEVPYDDLDIIDLTLYAKVTTRWRDTYHDSYWTAFTHTIKDLYQRLVWSIKLMVVGYIETETSFEFHGEEQIDAYLLAITEAKQKIIDNRKLLNVSQFDDLQNQDYRL